MFGDIVRALIWLAAKLFSLFMLAVAFVGVFCGGEGEGGAVVAAVMMALFVSIGVGHNTTAIPLLFWRYRKYHVFRIRTRNDDHYSIQMRLFGVWLYVTLDSGTVHTSFTGFPTLNRTFWWNVTMDRCQREVNSIIEAIKPDDAREADCNRFVFENYRLKRDE